MVISQYPVVSKIGLFHLQRHIQLRFGVHKVEGLALRSVDGSTVRLLAVVDDDDPEAPSAELDLRVELT